MSAYRIKMKIIASAFLLLNISVGLNAQISITSTERLPLGNAAGGHSPRFSADGKFIYFTTPAFDGIWEYSVSAKSVRQITADPGSGYGFALSQDGARIAFRRTTYQAVTHERKQEMIVQDLRDGTPTVVGSGHTMPVPTFSRSGVLYPVREGLLNSLPSASAGESVILGIENTKIALVRGGEKTLLDPFTNGSYIWPALSPDGKWIVSYEMKRGTFVSDIQGRVTAELGRRDAPAWSRDGKWIVYMRDLDDGHRILSSDLYCISPDGTNEVRLTTTPGIDEMDPQCSPTENLIVCSTLDGAILLMTYEEGAR